MTRPLRRLLSLALVAAAVALFAVLWPAPYGPGLAGLVALAAVYVAPLGP